MDDPFTNSSQLLKYQKMQLKKHMRRGNSMEYDSNVTGALRTQSNI